MENNYRRQTNYAQMKVENKVENIVGKAENADISISLNVFKIPFLMGYLKLKVVW